MILRAFFVAFSAESYISKKLNTDHSNNDHLFFVHLIFVRLWLFAIYKYYDQEL